MNMNENPFTKLRRQRIQQIKEMIRKEQPITNKKLLALIDIDMGLKEKTALTMLRSLQDGGFIEWEATGNTWGIKK